MKKFLLESSCISRLSIVRLAKSEMMGRAINNAPKTLNIFRNYIQTFEKKINVEYLCWIPTPAPVVKLPDD